MSTTTPTVPLRGAHIHHHLRGGHGRLRHRLLWLFAGGFAVLAGLGALGAIVAAPPAPRLCPPYRPCGPPPLLHPLVNQTVWRSSRYGFTLEYPADEARVYQSSPSSLTLNAFGGSGLIRVEAFPGSVSPAQAISDQVGGLNVTQVAFDTQPADRLLGGSVGYRPGAGRVFTGYLSAPQGESQQLSMASQAATDGRVTIAVIVLGSAGDVGPGHGLADLGDVIINSVRWGAGR